MKKAYICSVMPMDLTHYNNQVVVRGKNERGEDAPHFGYEYVLEAAPPNGYSVLGVEDPYRTQQDPTSMERPRYVFAAVDGGAEAIADSLVDTWTNHVIGSEIGQKPGVGRIAGSDPTPAELEKLRKQHESWCRFLVAQADQHEREGKPGLITGTHQAAAVYMKVNRSPSRQWPNEITPDSHKECFVCGELIRSAARRCRHCQVDLVQYAIENDLTQEEMNDSFIGPVVTRERKRIAHEQAKAAEKEKSQKKKEAVTA